MRSNKRDPFYEAGLPDEGPKGLPRYFILFSDMLMYCKIKSGDVFKKL
jgi:hypothetical protein